MSSPEPIITRIVIQRNQSLSWRGLGMFMALGTVPYLAFALMAGVAGWWPVVGFVGAVFMVLAGTLLGLTLGGVREVVTIRPSTVVVEYGRTRAESRVEMDRYWARVERRESPRPTLLLRSRGCAAEIGRALGDDERRALERRIRGLVGPGAAQPEREGCLRPAMSGEA